MQPDRNPATAQTRALSYDAGLRSFFQKIYNTMALGLVVTAVVAFGVANSPMALQFFLGNPMMRIIVMLAPLGFVFFGFTPRRVQTMSSGRLATLFYLFSAVFGISFATIFLVYSGTSIARVFFITAGMFAATSIYGYTTKRDLTGMAGLMIMGAFGIMIAMIVNIFMHSAAVQFAVSVIAVVVYTGLVAWDTQNMKSVYASASGTEANNKMAIMGALSLYINFIMIFQFMLQLTGGGNRR